jgi:lipid A 4'-phosphatase
MQSPAIAPSRRRKCWGVAVARGWLISSIAVGLVIGLLFAVFPALDLDIAGWFFNPEAGKFTTAFNAGLIAVREALNWLPWLMLIPPVVALVAKLIFPASRMLIAPSIVIYLIGSFLLGPGLISNLALKENWGRPRPNHVQQFGGTETFQPWWRPGGDCPRNCSFVSGEASQAFWTVAPASLAPPPWRPVALGAAIVYGSTVGGLRMVFGRHFFTDIVFSGVLTIAIVMALYRLLLDPVRRNDARLEAAITRVSLALHRGVAALLSGAGTVLVRIGGALREAGKHLHKRIACL